MASLLIPLESISGQEPDWVAHDSSPWFRLDLDCPEAGGWLALTWDVSLSDPVDRPLLAFLRHETDSDVSGNEIECHDALLAGTAFGRQSSVVPVPAGTREIRLSPGNRPGSYCFRLAEARWLSTPAAFFRGLRHQPFMALHALGAALIRRSQDFRLLLAEAIQTTPLARYAAWKQERTRQPEWQGFDAPRAPGLPAIHVLLSGDASARPDLSGLPPVLTVHLHAWPMGAAAHVDPLLHWLAGLPEADLVIPLPAGARLMPEALPAMACMAATARDAVLIYGDEEIGGTPEPHFRPGFDALWTFRALKDGTGIAVRAGALRQWLEAGIVTERVRAVALYRPLVARNEDARLPPYMTEWLEACAAAWPINQLTVGSISSTASILIPTRDRLELLRACIDSLTPTLPPDTELIVIENDSREPETLAYLEAFAGRPGCKVVPVEGAFNFSRLCNLGARQAKGDVLVFLNNDTTVVTPDWLATLMRFARNAEIGAVGARLLYPSGRLQHAGVVMGIGGYAGHVDLHLAGDSDGTFGRARTSHGITAVTGACLAVERAKFEAVGGFDEVNLPVDLNDIDLCLRLTVRGWRTVLAADAVLVHHESASRGRTSATPRYAGERAYFAARWQGERRNDPFYHPALSLQLTRVALG